MKHLVITIGCEYGAKGNAIGKKIAQDLGIKFYDRDLVDEIIKEVGIPTDIMDRVEEGGTIAGAGGAAHLPGMVAAKTTLPVIGVPVKSRALSGVDSLYSIVQMPGGVPVATMAIGEAGATNAALFALRLLSVDDKAIADALANFAEEQGKIAEESTNELN